MVGGILGGAKGEGRPGAGPTTAGTVQDGVQISARGGESAVHSAPVRLGSALHPPDLPPGVQVRDSCKMMTFQYNNQCCGSESE